MSEDTLETIAADMADELEKIRDRFKDRIVQVDGSEAEKFDGLLNRYRKVRGRRSKTEPAA